MRRSQEGGLAEMAGDCPSLTGVFVAGHRGAEADEALDGADVTAVGESKEVGRVGAGWRARRAVEGDRVVSRLRRLVVIPVDGLARREAITDKFADHDGKEHLVNSGGAAGGGQSGGKARRSGRVEAGGRSQANGEANENDGGNGADGGLVHVAPHVERGARVKVVATAEPEHVLEAVLAAGRARTGGGDEARCKEKK